MAVRHATLAAGRPGPGIGASMWDADHEQTALEYLIFHLGATGVYTLTPLTAGTVEPANAPMARLFVGDATYADQFRLAIGQRIVGAGGTSCNAQLQYATNGATQTTWADAAATANAGNVSLQAGAANVVRVGAWADLAAGAKIADLYTRLAIVTVGTVTTAPTISWAAALFR
jgi:hypothetical protein